MVEYAELTDRLQKLINSTIIKIVMNFYVYVALVFIFVLHSLC